MIQVFKYNIYMQCIKASFTIQILYFCWDLTMNTINFIFEQYLINLKLGYFVLYIYFFINYPKKTSVELKTKIIQYELGFFELNIPLLSWRRAFIFVSVTVNNNKTLNKLNLEFRCYFKKKPLHTHICKLIVKNQFDLFFMINI